MVLDKQVILPGQAIVLVTTSLRYASYRSYSAIYLSDQRRLRTITEGDYFDLYDFSFPLAGERSIQKLVNGQRTSMKDNKVTSGLRNSEFSALENFFQGRREPTEKILSPGNLYWVFARDGIDSSM